MSSNRLINEPLKLVYSPYSTVYASCVSCKCVACRQPLAPQLNTMLHTASHTFWILQLMSVVTIVRVFCVRSPMVRRQTLHTATLDDSRGKIYSGMRSGIMVVIRLVLCAQFIAWEELHSTSLAHRQRNDIVLNPAKVLVEPMLCSVHYSSDRSLNNCRCLSTSTTVPTDLSTTADVCRRLLQFRQISQQLQMSVDVHSSSHKQWSHDSFSVYQAQHVYMIWYDIFVNCNWVVTRWQKYSTHLHTNNT